MQLSELKMIVAANIIKLRTEAGITQAELGAKLNYSDKTISKWERGEAIPDAFILTQMSELFGVSVDHLLSSHDKWEAPKEEARQEVKYSTNMIMAVAIVAVWTMALTVFVALWLFGIIYWRVFVITLPVSILVHMILLCVFKRTRYLQLVISAFVLSIFVLLYFVLPMKQPWQLFLVAVPAIVIVFLSCNIRIDPGKILHHIKKSE